MYVWCTDVQLQQFICVVIQVQVPFHVTKSLELKENVLVFELPCEWHAIGQVSQYSIHLDLGEKYNNNGMDLPVTQQTSSSSDDGKLLVTVMS